jgi:hypothetical protein
MCATAVEKNIGEGRGFSMAFVADQQGDPGPLHVLELKDRLKLTPEQEIKAQALLTAMFAESRPKSAHLLDAERRLRKLFVDGRADEASVRTAVAEVERARSEVRMVHVLCFISRPGIFSWMTSGVPTTRPAGAGMSRGVLGHRSAGRAAEAHPPHVGKRRPVWIVGPGRQLRDLQAVQEAGLSGRRLAPW